MRLRRFPARIDDIKPAWLSTVPKLSGRDLEGVASLRNATFVDAANSCSGHLKPLVARDRRCGVTVSRDDSW